MFAHSDSFAMFKQFVICKYRMLCVARNRKTDSSFFVLQKAPLSIIDFVSIVPFYIELIAHRDTASVNVDVWVFLDKLLIVFIRRMSFDLLY
jgi:hypothetical protein